MKIIGWNGKSKESKPHHVDMWYDRHTRCWVVQLLDDEDNQIGTAVYVYSKREAADEKKYLEKEHKLKSTDTAKHSQVLYHFTSIQGAYEILKHKNFLLSNALGTPSDARINSNKQYYLSTARSKVGRYTKVESHWQGAVLNLHADWFSSRYKVKPVDYWGRSFDGDRETEDRILSNKREISFSNASQVINALHVFVKDMVEDKRILPLIRKLLILAKLAHIPIYVYSDKSAFLSQNTAKAIPLKSLLHNLRGEAAPVSNRKEQMAKRDVNPYIELFHKKDTKELSKEAKRVRTNLVYHNYNNDTEQSLMSAIHNGKSTASIGKLADLMRKSKSATVKDFLAKLTKKWEPIMKADSDAEHAKWVKQDAEKRKREQENGKA